MTMNNDIKYTELKPVDPDCRGYTNCFECTNCKALIYTYTFQTDIDYNCCPYCMAVVKDKS